MSETFYDHRGRPIAYCEDGEHLFSFSGQPIGYFYGDSVYAFDGKHLGVHEDGWLRDHRGGAALFSENTSGGPIKPIKQIKPIKGIEQIKPIKSIRQIAPIKAIKSLGWSNQSGIEFFNA